MNIWKTLTVVSALVITSITNAASIDPVIDSFKLTDLLEEEGADVDDSEDMGAFEAVEAEVDAVTEADVTTGLTKLTGLPSSMALMSQTLRDNSRRMNG